jgi:peptidoglycan-associated lipoprotein
MLALSLAALSKRRRLLVALPLVFALIAVAFVIPRPRFYLARAAFIASEPQSMSGTLGALSSVASQLGVPALSAVAASSATGSAQFYGDLLSSGAILHAIVTTTYDASAPGPGGTDSASARVTVTEETPAGDRPRTSGSTANPTIAALFGQWVQTIYFDLDKADLQPQSKDKLRRAAEWLTQGPNRSIVFRIEGNCDPRGTEEYNIGLGERRAQAAKEFLTASGVEASRIQTVSYGKERASGESEGSPDGRPSWAHDRRDDFIYVSGGTPRNP